MQLLLCYVSAAQAPALCAGMPLARGPARIYLRDNFRETNIAAERQGVRKQPHERRATGVRLSAAPLPLPPPCVRIRIRTLRTHGILNSAVFRIYFFEYICDYANVFPWCRCVCPAIGAVHSGANGGRLCGMGDE